MVKVKDTKTISKNVVEGSIRTYSKGKKTLNWVISEIKGENLTKEELKEIFGRVKLYSGINPRFQELQNKCKELDFL